MNKKGLSYVDWAISFGLFVIYLLAIFILIKPDVIDSYDSDFLNSIVQQGLEEDVYIDLTTYPLFIDTVSPGSHISLDLINNFQFLNNTNTVILDNNSNKLNFSRSSTRLNFDYDFTNGMNDFKIIYSEKLNYSNHVPFGETSISANYTIGIAEHRKGVYTTFFNDLHDIDYYDLKTKWGYPIQNEFAIEIYNGSDLTIGPELSYEYITPQIDAKVNVLMWSDWRINAHANNELVTMLIKTW
ncbi:hypothetical protein HOD61_00530 [archaeon]|jgi:hypothetical protein|nr:hypothetical protein [archaeon]